MEVKGENNSWDVVEIWDDYISWNFEFLWLECPKNNFPYIMFVYNKIDEDGEKVPANARHFYSKLLNFVKNEQNTKR